jgi:hypothetical protein
MGKWCQDWWFCEVFSVREQLLHLWAISCMTQLSIREIWSTVNPQVSLNLDLLIQGWMSQDYWLYIYIYIYIVIVKHQTWLLLKFWIWWKLNIEFPFEVWIPVLHRVLSIDAVAFKALWLNDVNFRFSDVLSLLWRVNKLAMIDQVHKRHHLPFAIHVPLLPMVFSKILDDALVENILLFFIWWKKLKKNAAIYICLFKGKERNFPDEGFAIILKSLTT